MRFNEKEYVVKTVEFEGEKVIYRAFENRVYVAHPVDDIQKLSIYVPEVYYQGESINGYQLKSAPIFMPNTVGGYMAGPLTEPGKPVFAKDDSIFRALQHGYVVVSAGIRGRKLKDNVGVAPACIVDYKAAVRYLRYHKDVIAGDTEKIISNGTSAGGALSSLLAASGNHPDYEPYLDALGATKERDDIFGASCYCPITNLDHADMAYEWEFEGLNEYLRKRHLPNNKTEMIHGIMTPQQIQMSQELKPLFKHYLESLHLKYHDHEMTLEDLKEYIQKLIIQSVNQVFKEGTDLSLYPWITIQDDEVKGIDYDAYIQYRTRMKVTPAFDNVMMGTPENELFGTQEEHYQHFTRYSYEHSMIQGKMADDHIIKMLNPMNYIQDPLAKTAHYYRIRHGASDRDTSLAISAILSIALKNAGSEVDHFYPWGVVHAGDYDLTDLFAWIDDICQKV